jgi:hypothetical protein
MDAMKQLAVDDRWIADSACIRRQIHPPRMHPQPVLSADRPWEKLGIILYGTVDYNEADGFRMWYKALDHERFPRVCYATSSNGMDWQKPELGICEFDGNTRNNIVFVPPGTLDGPNVIFDPDDAAAPYKMVIHLDHDGRRAVWGVTSPDGLNWKLQSQPFGPDFDDRPQAMAHRDHEGKLVVLGRKHDMFATYNERVVYRMTSDDFETWSEPQVVMKSDLADPPYMQCYSMTGFQWDSIYLGILEKMYVEPDVIDCELVFSPDGKDWQRIEPRTTFLPRGPEGSWNSHWVCTGSNPPPVYNDRLWWFLSGRTACHGIRQPDSLKEIGVASGRVDGFASLTTTEQGGWIRTRPFLWPGGELDINADTRRSMTMDPRFVSGEIRVEVLDENGAVMPGFSRDACQPFRRDNGIHTMTWTDKNMASLTGRTLALVFVMHEAHLYGFGNSA